MAQPEEPPMFDLGRTLLQSIERSPGRTAIVDWPTRLRVVNLIGTKQAMPFEDGQHDDSLRFDAIDDPVGSDDHLSNVVTFEFFNDATYAGRAAKSADACFNPTNPFDRSGGRQKSFSGRRRGAGYS